MKNKNEMWKLDLLESKFNNIPPRFPHTKKLLSAKHNSKLMKKLPTTSSEATIQINQLKTELFSMKYHAAYKKLNKEVTKLLNKTSLEFFKSEENVKLLITSKLIRLIINTILTSKDLKTNPPSYIMEDIRGIIIDNTNPANPSCFFKKFCQDNKELNNFISNIWNNKIVKLCLNEIEWSFRMVRGNISKSERDARKKVTGKSSEHDDEDEVPEGDSGEESEEPEESEESEESEEDANSEQDENIDLEKEYEKFAVYDKLVGDSDEEEVEIFQPDPNINYNEITDEEPSESESESEDEDDFFEYSDNDTKHDLPQLATGYYSGGSDEESDDDVDNDKIVKELTTQRKNRRGQRARQKIWAKKYGKNAKHVKLQQEQYANERQKRQLEFEERERKRELKRKLAEQPTGANTAPLGERKQVAPTTATTATTATEIKTVHPSWEAKKKQEEMLKAKFQGKKITFD